MAVFTVFTYFFVPETKNKTFEEIAHQFSPGDHIEVEELVDDVFADGDDAFPVTSDNSEPDEEHSLVTINFRDRVTADDDADAGEEDRLVRDARRREDRV